MFFDVDIWFHNVSYYVFLISCVFLGFSMISLLQGGSKWGAHVAGAIGITPGAGGGACARVDFGGGGINLTFWLLVFCV